MTVSIMCVGAILLTATGAGLDGHGFMIFYIISQFVFGYGVGGEYPMAAGSAAERAEAGGRAKAAKRGMEVVLTFSMQGELCCPQDATHTTWSWTSLLPVWAGSGLPLLTALACWSARLCACMHAGLCSTALAAAAPALLPRAGCLPSASLPEPHAWPGSAEQQRRLLQFEPLCCCTLSCMNKCQVLSLSPDAAGVGNFVNTLVLLILFLCYDTYHPLNFLPNGKRANPKSPSYVTARLDGVSLCDSVYSLTRPLSLTSLAVASPGISTA